MQTSIPGSLPPSVAPGPSPAPAGTASRAPGSRAIALDADRSFGDRLELSVMESFPAGAGNYVIPTPATQEGFRAVVAGTLRGLRTNDASALDQARRGAECLGYGLSEIEVGGEPYLALQEAGTGRGWPTVVFNLRPSSGVVVEAPHPGYDLGTPELAWRAFRAFRADVCIVAGAQRANRGEPSPDVPHGSDGRLYSVSDPTHTRATLFQAAHQGATGAGSRVLQVHGFSAARHHERNPAFPAALGAVLSDGADDHFDPPGLVECTRALREAGIDSHLVTFEGPLGGDLGAATNVQRRDMEERGLVGRGREGEFIHVELDSGLRAGPEREATFDRIVGALRPVFIDEI